MTINLKLALIAITLVYIILILKKIIKKEIQASQCTFWLVSGILLIIASAVPNLIEVLTKALGFEVPANMLFCILVTPKSTGYRYWWITAKEFFKELEEKEKK